MAEAIVGTVEAFFATAFELDAFANAERFDVTVVETNITRFEVKVDIDRMSATVRWPSGVFPRAPSVYGDFLNMLLEVGGTIFSATCRAKNFEEASTRLFKTDAAMDRVAMIGSLCLSRSRIFGGVSRLSFWDKHSPKRFEARPDMPRVERERRPTKADEQAKGEVRDETEFQKLTDHRDVKVRSVIDIHLWDRAGWMGAAYGVLNSKAPPFMALMFKDRDAAVRIFERWRERFGSADEEEDIHIGIVRRFSAEHPTHYGMVITSKVQRDLEDSRLAVFASRSLTMEPADDVNLTGFLDLYKKAGTYLLMPVVMVPGQAPQFIDEHYLLKRSLHVKMAADVGPNDLENMFLKPRGLGQDRA